MTLLMDHVFDEGALLERLTAGVIEGQRPLVFVVGSPLTYCSSMTNVGVPDVNRTIGLIRDVFSTDKIISRSLDEALDNSDNKYQTAFNFLRGRRGQDAANKIIRRAVLSARNIDLSKERDISVLSDEYLRELENDSAAWTLSPGVKALGELAARERTRFGHSVITSNFDPLIEIAIRNAGGCSWRTSLYSDGNVGQSSADGCHVIHIHGYWIGSDTLHTGNQLSQHRPALRHSLGELLQRATIVVMAYGGWQDVFTETLKSLSGNANVYLDVLWALHGNELPSSPYLADAFTSLQDRGRIAFYSNIDCHRFLPALNERWLTLQRSSASEHGLFVPETELAIVGAGHKQPVGEALKADCDRPPSIDAWVGRDVELSELQSSAARVAIICGIGGQGKSVLAAKYLTHIDAAPNDVVWDWRDCREEGDRLRTQVVGAIERISQDSSLGPVLRAGSDSDIVSALISLAEECNFVLVLDNVDHYVDLENGIFVGLLDLIVREFARSVTKSKIIITCRPFIAYGLISLSTISLDGLSVSEAFDLFERRFSGKELPLRADIEAAHAITKGHAFWLDLMAVQVARPQAIPLARLLEDIRRGRDEMPDLLASIWVTLSDRQQLVLRSMTETKRSETIENLADYVSSSLSFKNFHQALKSLISLHLVILKPQANAPDQYDLHPLVRQFVRRSFQRPERMKFIEVIIDKYSIIMKAMSSFLGAHMPFSYLEHWSQRAELEIEAGRYDDALETLHNSEDSFLGSGNIEEFVRVARKLFESIDWIEYSGKSNKFDAVLISLIHCLDLLEEYDDSDRFIASYDKTIAQKTTRYIRYANARAHSYWVRRQYDLAIEWGTLASELKDSSGADVNVDCTHNLALAKRDGGAPDEALPMFLGPHTLEELISPENAIGSNRPGKDGPLYGNVGRCLQLLGRNEDALSCYRTSARALEDDTGPSRHDNRAFARRWIAEVFEQAGDPAKAAAFYVNAEELWARMAPGRAREMRDACSRIRSGCGIEIPSRVEARRLVDAWLR